MGCFIFLIKLIYIIEYLFVYSNVLGIENFGINRYCFFLMEILI